MNQNNEPPRMVFEDREFQQPRFFRAPTPRMAQWVIKYSGGLIKAEKQASYVLIGFAAVAVIISLFLIFDGAPEIPKKALENPEYGLPEAD